jgi:hypothetical protein
MKSFLITICFFSLVLGLSETQNITVEIKISCPKSVEFNKFLKSIPTGPESTSDDFEEWKISFINNMKALLELVESENVNNTSWSVAVVPNQELNFQIR